MEKKELAQSVFEIINNAEFDKFEENMAENASFDFPGVRLMEGRKRIILFFKALLRKYKYLTFNVSEIILEGDKACAVWANKGEYRDGANYTNRGITLFYFIGGKISFISDYFKDTSFTQNK